MLHRLRFSLTLLCACILTAGLEPCLAQELSAIDSLNILFSQGESQYSANEYEAAGATFGEVMRAAYLESKKSPELSDQLLALRLKSIRYYILIERDIEDFETSNKWVNAGIKMVSRESTDLELIRYWTSGFGAERKINEEIVESHQKYLAYRESLKKRSLVILAVTSCLLAIFLIILFSLYHKLKHTSSFLARKNEEIAADMLAPKIASPTGSGEKPLEDRVVRHIIDTKAYLNPDLCLEDLCRDLGTNRTYISRTFSDMSTNFSTFINRLRVSEAVNMLSSQSGKSIEDIWASCGFKSQTTFYNRFKEITGLTPSQFKKSNI